MVFKVDNINNNNVMNNNKSCEGDFYMVLKADININNNSNSNLVNLKKAKCCVKIK